MTFFFLKMIHMAIWRTNHYITPFLQQIRFTKYKFPFQERHMLSLSTGTHKSDSWSAAPWLLMTLRVWLLSVSPHTRSVHRCKKGVDTRRDLEILSQDNRGGMIRNLNLFSRSQLWIIDGIRNRIQCLSCSVLSTNHFMSLIHHSTQHETFN